MRIILLLICTVTLLATSGCLIPVSEGGGSYHGHSDHDDHDDHGGDHHDNDNH
jgi:hypothetical protein